MNDKSRRKELSASYKQSHPEAGVFRIVNARNGKVLLGSAANLASMRNKLEFARSTSTPSALDRKLQDDIREFGLEAFSFEVLESFEPSPELTATKIREELAVLEALWREKLDPALLY
jgi:hypothetical protein